MPSGTLVDPGTFENNRGTVAPRLLHRTWCLVLIVACLLGACSCGIGSNNQTSNPSQPSSPVLATSSNSVNFGHVSVGHTASSKVTLSNSSAVGSSTITVTQVSASGAGFRVGKLTLPMTIDPGQSAQITVMFSPSSAGSSNGQLSVTTQDNTQPTTVDLSGDGLAAGQLGVSPSSMSFGGVSVGSSKSISGSLTAGGGGADVTISSASWNGQGYQVSGITFPVTVSAGTSIPFTVTFAPQTSGSVTGQVSFVSNASNSPANVSLSGTGNQIVQQHSVDLNWDPSTSQVVGYNVYRGTQPGGPFLKINSSPTTATAYSDSTVSSGQTYYYTTTSVDSAGVESKHSNVVSVTIP